MVDEVYSSDDFEVLPYFMARMIARFQKLETCPGEENQAQYTENITVALVKIVEKTMLKTKILKGVPEVSL